MKRNTVIIGTEEYYQLRKFKEETTGREVVAVSDDGWSTIQYVSKDNAIAVLGRKLKEKRDEFNDKNRELYDANLLLENLVNSNIELKRVKKTHTSTKIVGMIMIYIIGFVIGIILTNVFQSF